jgi:hypothetical protein
MIVRFERPETHPLCREAIVQGEKDGRRWEYRRRFADLMLEMMVGLSLRQRWRIIRDQIADDIARKLPALSPSDDQEER